MAQISFKIPDAELDFLQWLSKKTSNPVSSIYRNATLDAFREWKLFILLKEYQDGSLGFKELCKLGNITLNQGALLLEQRNIEPPISELVDVYSSKIRDHLTVENIFKEGKNFKRTSKVFQAPNPMNE